MLSDQCNYDHGCSSPARHRLCTALRRHLCHDRGYRGYGQWKTHIRAEGIIFSAATVGLKVGSGIGTWAVTSFLGAAGFNGALAEQSASAMTAISNLYKFGPIIVWVVILLVLMVYHLDRDYDTIINDLSAREQNGEM